MKRCVVVVTGDRHATPQEWEKVISDVWDNITCLYDQTVLIHGDCSGVDRIAASIAGDAVIPMPYIGSLGNNGGPVRNKYMLDIATTLEKTGWRAYCVGFHNDLHASRGTKNCVKQAKARGVDTHVFRSDGTKY